MVLVCAWRTENISARSGGKYGQQNNFYLISDEPDGIGTKEHQFWEKLKKGKKIKLIHSEEADIVAQKIEETDAGMFLEIE